MTSSRKAVGDCRYEEAVSARSSPSNARCCDTEVVLLYGSPVDQAPIDSRTELQMLSDALAAPGIHLRVGTANADSLTHFLARAHSSKHLLLCLSAHGVYGKSNQVGLSLESPDGMAHILWLDELDELLTAHEAELAHVFLVFLSTCSSEKFAQVFIEHGCRHVIAVRDEVLDRAARKFAQFFFGRLAAGASVLKSFESARARLRIDSDPAIKSAAEKFVLFGQHSADSKSLCAAAPHGTEDILRTHLNFDSNCDLEDAKMCLSLDLPSPNAYFVGRREYLRAILDCFRCNRVCVIHGGRGLGKRTLSQEFARYSSSPGRLFSCCAVCVEPEGADILSLASAILKAVSRLVQQHLGTASTSPTFELPADAPEKLMDSVLQITAVLRRLEHFRHRPVLIVINDRAGIVNASEEARVFLAELIERTELSHFLLCAAEPIHGLLGRSIAKNILLSSLSRYDAARLFLKCVQRRLGPSDFPGGQAPPVNVLEISTLLSGHPLLLKLGGNPRRICEVATELVVPNGLSLLDIAVTLPLGDCAS